MFNRKLKKRVDKLEGIVNLLVEREIKSMLGGLMENLTKSHGKENKGQSRKTK